MNIPPFLLTGGGSYTKLTFTVLLSSGLNVKRTHFAYPSRDDVTVQKFVLTDDKGDILAASPESINGTDISGKMVYGDYPGSHRRKQSYDVFAMRYIVSFPILDAQGSSLISPGATKLTLHIITPPGEQSVDYKMEDLKN